MERAKKECILEAAARAFSRAGFKKASVDEIAKDAGVAKGTVYLASDSKEHLFFQSVHREVREVVGELSKLIDPTQPADQLLQDVARQAVMIVNQRPLVRGLFACDFHAQLPRWVDQMEELRALGRTNIVEILRLGQRQGRFRAELDVDEVAKILQDLMIATYMFYVQGGQIDVEAVVKRGAVGMDLILNGIRRQGK
jgi:AcrR family transcriptional regulator